MVLLYGQTGYYAVSVLARNSDEIFGQIGRLIVSFDKQVNTNLYSTEDSVNRVHCFVAYIIYSKYNIKHLSKSLQSIKYSCAFAVIVILVLSEKGYILDLFIQSIHYFIYKYCDSIRTKVNLNEQEEESGIQRFMHHP